MALVQEENIIALYIENETVCRECATDEEESDAKLDDLLLKEETENWIFCDRYRERIS